MSKILSSEQDANVADLVVDALEDAGYEPEEAIPGLILAARLLTEVTTNPEQALAEAIYLLDSEPVPEEFGPSPSNE